MQPTITTTIEPHTRIDVSNEPKYVDLEAGQCEVKTEDCCEPRQPLGDYDPERVLKALGISFLLGALVATTLCFAFSSNYIEE
ncbi:MAG: hypothetical protein L7T80_09240 [Arenicellales bacterium]|nr:hypothetical protein [Arenicellales bacterium]